ncbi:hypothetical protein [Halorarius litoreus]|uniref:hypothetical protein n=1 Tax=Halorarius litoreus TaxID=2962676 RepID=UPI0020CD1A45|nr:hypothetical protein [Halorarius litoreus]
MVDYRTLAAAVLGVGLGVLLIVAPEGILRVQFTGRVPGDRHGEYGSDDGYSPRLVLLVRAIGVLVLLAGGYFGATVFGLV